MNANNFYSAVLSYLRARRSEIDQAIIAIERLANSEATNPPLKLSELMKGDAPVAPSPPLQEGALTRYARQLSEQQASFEGALRAGLNPQIDVRGTILGELYGGMTLPNAIKKLLNNVPVSFSAEDIVQQLEQGGFEFGTKTPANSVAAAMSRMLQEEGEKEILRVGRGRWIHRRWGHQ